jgi:nucleoside-triphosphatase
MHILLTGKPGSGKTTLIKRIIQELDYCGGFYTEEIVEAGQRTGFKIRSLDGKEGILAKKGLNSRYKLGSYGINLRELEEIGVRAVEQSMESKEIIIIDEIGKMELFSERFKDTVLKALDSGKRVLGVIHIADLPFLDNIRKRGDVILFEVNLRNQEDIFKKALDFLKP